MVAATASGCATIGLRPAETGSPAEIIGHPVRTDANRRLLSWSDTDCPYALVARLAFHALETKFPAQDNRLPTWLGYSRFDPDTFEGIAWPHNPAGLYAMLTESAVLWYAFSGDQAALDLARRALDYQIDHGTTPRQWDWAEVPYASAGAGDEDYRGADDRWCDFCGRGDGIGVIEPDKVGELGFAYLQMFELTGDGRYRNAAIACADALAKHARPGDDRRSPWPFRVYAQSNVIREEYSSNVVGAVTLFDELDRLSLGDVDGYASARALAVDWLMRVPMINDAWSGYFEDIDIQPDPRSNLNQYSALRTARWLLAHRGADPEWRVHVAHLLSWAARTFGVDTAQEKGRQWGATVMSEQGSDMAKMASHTARFGVTTALWSEATGDDAARERAALSLNWATYACREDGIVAVGQDANEGFWFSDGYADYIRHFLVAMAAVPDWAPAHEDHLLRSTSIVTHVEYAPGAIRWTTFDSDATETLRLAAPPVGVFVAGAPLAATTTLLREGYTTRALASGGTLVRVRHVAAADVLVRTSVPAGVMSVAQGEPAANGAPSRAAMSGVLRAGALAFGTAFALVLTACWRARRRFRAPPGCGG